MTTEKALAKVEVKTASPRASIAFSALGTMLAARSIVARFLHRLRSKLAERKAAKGLPQYSPAMPVNSAEGHRKKAEFHF